MTQFKSKPSETEIYVQWWDRVNGGWNDLEGFETETKAFQGAQRFIDQDIALGVEKPRYRVVTLTTTELAPVEEVEALLDAKYGPRIDAPHPGSSLNDFPEEAETKAVLLAEREAIVIDPPKPRKGVRVAGPTPDGGYIERRTPNEYSHAVAVIDTAKTTYKPRDPNADEHGYIANPTEGQWVSLSWHRSQLLAIKGVERGRRLGYRAVVVPVIESV